MVNNEDRILEILKDKEMVMRQVFQLPEQNGHGELLMKGILNRSMNLNMESMQDRFSWKSRKRIR